MKPLYMFLDAEIKKMLLVNDGHALVIADAFFYEEEIDVFYFRISGELGSLADMWRV